jgi:dienelactone hydrolase/pimeloyl-ACP methyl ester carboxylesterase
MAKLTRRELLGLAAASSVHLARVPALYAQQQRQDVHRQLLELAARQQQQRRDRFATVTTPAQLSSLQKSLRDEFIQLIGGLPTSNLSPPVSRTRGVEADDYSIEKLVFESFPGYFVPALLYRPKMGSGPKPAVLSPCGHSAVGKAADTYQILHINLARRGFIVLTYDPVGQGERSQFWDPVKRSSRFNLVCGEHAVLGNPLYLLGTSLARYRIWDGTRAIDYLISLPEVDAKRIGCVGNSGGGTLTAYISALDSRVAAAAICCYITALPRRMANRIEKDPDADPEQDIFGFVSAGIDHAGLLALRAPKPTLIGAAQDDFFPIEGARESFAEAQQLFAVAGAAERIALAEAPGRHGLSLTLRTAVYRWFDRWLAGGNGDESITELPVGPRPAQDLLVTESGQVNVSLKSRHLLPLVLEQFRDRPSPTKRPLRDVLLLDPESAEYRLTEISPGKPGNPTLVVCVNGNESLPWSEEKELLATLADRGFTAVMIDPRGVGSLRPTDLRVGRRDYADPLVGVEENLAYNAFLLGKSLLGMRVSDVLAAIRDLANKTLSPRIVLCGRRDAALVSCFAAALEPKIHGIAGEELSLSYLRFFDTEGTAINAASIAPGLLHSFGDIPEVLGQIAPRKMLIAAGFGDPPAGLPAITYHKELFTKQPRLLLDWLSQG